MAKKSTIVAPSADVSPGTSRAITTPLLRWFAVNARDLPWRRTPDPYAIWVSEIMLQQTQVKTVIPYFERWMNKLPTIASLAGARSDTIHKLWEGLGYYTRVRNMQRSAQTIMAERGGKFPSLFAEVLALPGIGHYTAGAICSIAFNQPTPILDGNVIRVLARVFGIRENTRDKATTAQLWKHAAALVSAVADQPALSAKAILLTGACSALNQGLMELGATICTPREPQCAQCPIQSRCAARREGIVDRLPNLERRVEATRRRFVALVVSNDDRFLVRQRAAELVNGHLWEFPNTEIPLKASARAVREAAEQTLGCTVDQLENLCVINHTITRYRISLEVFAARLNGSLPNSAAGLWKTQRALDELAFSSAHRQIAEKLQNRTPSNRARTRP